MSTQALFLAWQDQISSRQWFPIGRPDVDVERSKYRFRYTGGAERAQKEDGFPLAKSLPKDVIRYSPSGVPFDGKPA